MPEAENECAIYTAFLSYHRDFHFPISFIIMTDLPSMQSYGVLVNAVKQTLFIGWLTINETAPGPPSAGAYNSLVEY